MSKSNIGFWCNLFDKVESMLLWVVFKHNNRRPKCTAYEALFFYQVLTLHYEMISTQTVHCSDDEHDECFTRLWGTVENMMGISCNSLLNLTAERLLEVADNIDGLKRKPSQGKIVNALRWYVENHGDVHYKCYHCGHIGIAPWVNERYRVCENCKHWYLMPLQKNVDYKETMTAAYISGFFEWCGIKNEKAKSVMDIWKLRMESMKIFNEADGDNVRFFSNHVVSSEDSQEYCFCLERFEAGSVVKLLPCGHLMHSACLREHIVHSDVRAHDPVKRPRCWVCREPLMKVRDPGKSKRKKRHRRRALEDI